MAQQTKCCRHTNIVPNKEDCSTEMPNTRLPTTALTRPSSSSPPPPATSLTGSGCGRRHRSYYCGFNGFSQFEFGGPEMTCKPIEFMPQDASFLPNVLEPIIASTWSYNAIAAGNSLLITGFLWPTEAVESRSTPARCAKSFSSDICKLAVNDGWCVVLLENNEVHKISMVTGLESTLEITVGEKVFRHFADVVCTHAAIIVLDMANSVHTLETGDGKHEFFPFPVSQRIVKMCAGGEHVVMLTANGDVFVYGSGLRGQLGQGDTTDASEPVQLDALGGIRCVDIGAGAWHSAAVTAFGDLYTWGWNLNGQTGRAIHERRPDGTRRKLPSVFVTATVLDLPLAGWRHCAQLIVESDNDSDSGSDAAIVQDQYEMDRVWCGARHTVVRTKCGKLLACGWNRYGQLGISDDNSKCALDNAQDGIGEECIETRFREIVDAPSGVKNVFCGSWSTVFVVPCESEELN